MPSKAEHKTKAEHDEFFVSKMENPFWDWAVTGMFYAALQYVEAYLATQNPPRGFHSPTHPIRDSHIQRDPRIKGIYGDYRQLEDESREARYDAAMAFAQTDVQRLGKYLDAIKKVIVPLIT